MSDTINRLYENQFGTSPKTQQDADDYASMMNVWSNTKDPEELEQAHRTWNVKERMDENPNAGMLKYTYATADATGVAHDNIDAELANNRQEKLEKIILQSKEEGSIRALPYLQTAEGQQTMLDIAMGSAFPGAAIGRVSKAAVTGGSSIFPRLTKNAKWLQQKELSKADRRDIAVGRSGRNWTKFNEFFKKPSAKWHSEQNKVNSNRIAMEKALDKHKVQHNKTVNDPITEILRALKYRKN
jgi:hypothetical protein